MPEAVSSIALTIRSHGLQKLTDPNWTGLDLFYLLKPTVRKEKLLRKTKKDGLLYHLGKWFYSEYVLDEGDGYAGDVLVLRGDLIMRFALLYYR